MAEDDLRNLTNIQNRKFLFTSKVLGVFFANKQNNKKYSTAYFPLYYKLSIYSKKLNLKLIFSTSKSQVQFEPLFCCCCFTSTSHLKHMLKVQERIPILRFYNKGKDIHLVV